MITTWSTREPLDDGFRAAWERRLAASPHAHYAMRLDLLAWEAGHGRHARAVLVEGGVRGALVLREASQGWVSGWPWRWQALVEDGGATAGLTASDTAALADAARAHAGGRRLRFHVPEAPPRGWPGYVAGATVHQSLEGTEEALWKRLEDAKRRNIKKALREGLEVRVANRPEQFQAFKRLQLATDARRAQAPAEASSTPPAPAMPAPGEAWREWELPWQWLLVAEREGVVEAGSGFGGAPGGTLDYRTNASSDVGKRAGANILLGWEAIRRGRELGYRRLNWGGATRFKREIGGEPIAVCCALGGGAVWRVPNHVTASLHRARPRVAALWRRVARARKGGGP